MKNTIIKTPTKGKNYFGFNDTDIVVSSKKHKDIESLIGSMNKKGILEKVYHIPISEIISLNYNEKNSVLSFKYMKDSKEKNLKITYWDSETRNSIANDISQLSGLNKSNTTEGKIKPLLINLFFILLASLFAVSLTGISYDIGNGGEAVEVSGRRSGIFDLIVSVATSIGPIGVGIIGGLGVLYLIRSTSKRWKNPANNILYSRLNKNDTV